MPSENEPRVQAVPRANSSPLLIRRRLLAVFLGLLPLLIAINLASAQEATTTPATLLEHWFEVSQPPAAEFTEIQMVLDFAPGSSVGLHTHGGPGYITMLSGAMTMMMNGVKQTFSGGDSFVEYPDGRYEGGNNGDQTARLMVTYLIPKGHEVTILEDGSATNQNLPPGPTVITQASREVTNAPENFQIVHLVQQYPGGSRSVPTSYGGEVMMTVVDGELSVAGSSAIMSTAVDGEAQVDGRSVQSSGDTVAWSVTAGDAFSVTNEGEDAANTVVSVLLPTDTALTTLSSTLPATGIPDAHDATGAVWLLAISGVAVISGGGMLVHRSRNGATHRVR